MFTYGLFWLIMGMLSILVIAGAKAWADKLNVDMNWWKWALSGLWYIGFLFAFAVPATFIGEGEVAAGLKMGVFSVVPSIIVGFIVFRIIVSVGKPKA